MRYTCLVIALLISGASALSLAQSNAVPPVPPASRHYSTSETSIGTLMEDPAAKAILDKYIPSISQSGRIEMIRNATLKSIQGYGAKVLTDQVLADIDAELAKLIPIEQTGPTSSDAWTLTTDESKVRTYTLPDPLKLSNGQPVLDANTWWEKRRPEIYAMFETLEFGRAPGRPADQYFEVIEKGTPAMNGKAIRKQVMIYLSKDPTVPNIHLVEYIPAKAKKPVPMMLMIGFAPPANTFDDPGLGAATRWDGTRKERVVVTIDNPMGKMDITAFLDAGIGVASYYYQDVDPDSADGYVNGIRSYFDKNTDPAKRAPDAWGSMAAWGWSLSRVQDYFETDDAVDAKRVAINGASRLGSTALWAGARDQRFAAVVVCCGGPGIARRNFGAAIGGTGDGTSEFWRAENYKKFRIDKDALPMDGHMELALIAPRPVFMQTGKYDHAGDPKGMFLAAVAAEPVYKLLGKQGLGATEWPPAGPILNDIGYYMNDGGHGMQPGDWDIYLAFLKKHLRP